MCGALRFKTLVFQMLLPLVDLDKINTIEKCVLYVTYWFTV